MVLEQCSSRANQSLRQKQQFCVIGTSSFPGTADVRFLLNGITYQNNSLVTLEDIGEDNDALLCRTDNMMCCSRDEVPGREIRGDWYFPNGDMVPNSRLMDGTMPDIYRNRGDRVVRLNRKRGGVTGIYRCEMIPDTEGVFQTMYIGVYTASTGECYMYTAVLFNYIPMLQAYVAESDSSIKHY